MSSDEIKEKMIRVKWGDPENLPPIYANHIYVTHSGDNEFHLVFGYFMPPLAMGLEEDELPESVEIKPVARIILSPEFMEKFLDVIKENYSKYADKEGENND